jgi:hypothetical protein
MNTSIFFYNMEKQKLFKNGVLNYIDLHQGPSNCLNLDDNIEIEVCIYILFETLLLFN